MQPGWRIFSILYAAICCMWPYVCLYMAYMLFIGSSGDTFLELSFGAHTMNVRFTRDGYCQPLTEKPLNMSIKCKQLLL